MNEKKIDVETCIKELKEIVFDAIKEEKEWLGPSAVRDKAGIHNCFKDKEARKWTTPFTRAILFELREEGRVLGEERGPLRNGKLTLVWKIADEE